MSNNKIDQFFSRKLETHSATPSADAWSRLESKLDKKEKKAGFVWWQFAAAILLLLTIGGLFYNSMQSEDSTNMGNETILLAEEDEAKDNNNILTEDEKVQENEQVEEPEILIADNKPAVSEKSKATLTSTRSNLIAQNEAKVTEKPIEISIAELEKVVAKSDLEDVETLGLVIPTEVVKPTEVIQVASYEVEIYRGLSQPSQPATTAKAQTQEKKNTFKRAFEIAMDVKNGEIGLDDLRVLKDDLISNIDDDNKTERNRKVIN